MLHRGHKGVRGDRAVGLEEILRRVGLISGNYGATRCEQFAPYMLERLQACQRSVGVVWLTAAMPLCLLNT